MADPTIPPPPEGVTIDAPVAPSPVEPIIGRTPAPQTPAQVQKDQGDADTATNNATISGFKVKEEGLTEGKQQAQKDMTTAGVDNLVSSIESAKKLVNGWSTGVVGQALHHIGGTEAAQLKSIIDQEIKGNVFLTTLQQRQQDSPNNTGSTPGGRILQSEVPMITGALGTLDPSALGDKLTTEKLNQIAYRALRAKAIINGDDPSDPAVQKKYGIDKYAAVLPSMDISGATPSGPKDAGTSPPGANPGGNTPGGTPPAGPTNLSPVQKQAYDAFLAANPNPTGDQVGKFLTHLTGHQVANGDDIAKAIAEGRGVSSAISDFGANLKNDVAGVVQGVGNLPDMAATAVGKVASVIPTAVGYGLDKLGYKGAASSAYGIAHGLANPVTVGGTVESVAPTPDTAWGRGNRLFGQVVGGAVGFPTSAAENVVSRFAGEVPKGFVSPAATAAKVAPTVVSDAKDAGVRVMTSDVSPPKTFIGKAVQAIGERIPITGTGSARAAQQAERVNAVKSLAHDYGAATGDALASPGIDAVAQDLATKRGADLTRLTNQKNAVIDGISGSVPTPNAIQAIDQQVAKLQGINSDAYAPVVAKLENFKQQLASGKSLSQIEGNRKLLGDMFADPSLAAIRGDGEKALNAIYGPLRDDMGTFIKANGSGGDFNNWQTANNGLSAMASGLNNTALKRALNTADTTPENVASLLFSQKPSDVRTLYANLSPAGKAKAQAAILQKAVSGAGGMENLSPDRFVNQVSSLGKSVGVFFQDDDLARIEGLTRVLNATRRAGQASVSPPTGVQAMPYAMGAGFTELFGIPGGLSAAAGTGLLARAYESAPVRNVLLRLGRTTAGSDKEGALLQRAGAAISAAVQNHIPNGAFNDNIARSGAAVASPNQRPNQQQ